MSIFFEIYCLGFINSLVVFPINFFHLPQIFLFHFLSLCSERVYRGEFQSWIFWYRQIEFSSFNSTTLRATLMRKVFWGTLKPHRSLNFWFFKVFFIWVTCRWWNNKFWEFWCLKTIKCEPIFWNIPETALHTSRTL